MSFPLYLASGHGLLLIVFLGVPAATIGMAFFGAAGLLAARKTKEDMRGALVFAVIGAVFLSFLFICPRLDPLVCWALGNRN